MRKTDDMTLLATRQGKTRETGEIRPVLWHIRYLYTLSITYTVHLRYTVKTPYFNVNDLQWADSQAVPRRGQVIAFVFVLQRKLSRTSKEDFRTGT